ncbi:MAG TPA: hypothetical protein IAC41_09065 [Candidatus Merdenecus merdavium]|nr:hypothetical protein [Candidatus Merdenecus merdavium]
MEKQLIESYITTRQPFIMIDGKKTSDIVGVIFNGFSEKKVTKLRYDKEEIFGRDGYVISTDGAYDGHSRSASFITMNEGAKKELLNMFDSIEEMEIIFSDNGGKFNRGVIADIEIKAISNPVYQIEVEFDLQPFYYSPLLIHLVATSSGIVPTVEIASEVYLTMDRYQTLLELNLIDDRIIYHIVEKEEQTKPIIQGTAFYNEGVETDEVKVIVHGTGTGNITINGRTMRLTVPGALVIDSKEQDVTTISGDLANSRRIFGDFFKLKKGFNGIGYDASVFSKLEITYRERWKS